MKREQGGREDARRKLAVFGAILLVGLGAGVAGVALVKLQQIVQAIAYGYLQAPETDYFVEVTSAEPLRRFLVLVLCGAIGGAGWVCIHRFGRPLLTVKKAVVEEGATMPFFTTLCHTVLQTATVAMGSPLGKEAAPRELSIAITGLWLKRTKLFADERMRKSLLAAAAGAGLAAIYNAPLAGTLFTMETLLLTWDLEGVGLAAVACAVAVFVQRLAMGDVVTYHVPSFAFDGWTLLWCLIMAPVLAFVVILFEKSRRRLPQHNRKSATMIVSSICAFAAIGAIAAFFPLVLGNGQIGNELSFMGQADTGEAFAYWLLKWACVLLALYAGAYGGNIQPSIMMGGMLSFGVAALWNAAGLPFVPCATAAFVGGAVFLGLAQKMPATAIAFLVEITRCSASCFLPLCLCVGVACVCYKAMGGKLPVVRAPGK